MNRKQTQDPAKSTELDYMDDPAQQTSGKYGILFLGAVAIIIAIAIFFVWQANQRYSQETAAQKLYSNAQSSEAWLAIVGKYPKTAVAAQALIRTASQASKESKHESAIRFYQQFLEKFPDHPAYPACQLAVAASLEASKDLPRARAAYQEIVQNRPHPFVVPAMLGLTRIDLAQNNSAHARQLLQQIIADYPYSALHRSAQQMLVELEHENAK